MEALQVQPVDTEKRAITRALRAALIATVAFAVVLLVLLATASGNTRIFERNYPMLLWTTVGTAGVLFALVLELLRRLVTRYRRRVFGTRLMARMAGAFVAMTLLPVALVFVVAVQFIGRSIESWFDVPLEHALDSGLNLARASLDSQLSDLTQRARVIASQLADSDRDKLGETLSRLRDQGAVQEALLLSGTGRILTSSTSQYARLLPDLPPAEAMRQVRMTRQYSRVEGGDSPGAELKLRVIVALPGGGRLPDDQRYLQLVQPVPTALGANAEAVEQGYREFEELSIARTGLKRIFNVTLTLTFLLTVFAAVAAAFMLAGWLTGPLSELAAATRLVGEGDFRPVKDYLGRDELGELTRSFNAMTRQLDDARSAVARNQRELERVNARLESVLANLDAGVLVLDSGLNLTLANPGAERIIGAPLAARLGGPLADVPRVGELVPQVRAAFNETAASGEASWQRQFELRREPAATGGGAGESSEVQTILARGSTLHERRAGYVMVFDDISQVISAQRAIAWAEVARRLAHEIKNPLTPIQLAAERMQLKLGAKLAAPDAELLDKNTRTIVNQVQALKMMVDEFRDYARLPAAHLEPLNLNALVEEVLALYPPTGPGESIRIALDERLPLVMGDATQLRQVIHNLLKNAREAAERSDPCSIAVTTEALRLTDGSPAVRLAVRDNGPGFTPAFLARAFEPYVTSKPRGTGLGLAIVRKIVDEHRARIDLANWSDESGRTGGAQVAILFTNLEKTVENRRLQARAGSEDDGHG